MCLKHITHNRLTENIQRTIFYMGITDIYTYYIYTA